MRGDEWGNSFSNSAEEAPKEKWKHTKMNGRFLIVKKRGRDDRGYANIVGDDRYAIEQEEGAIKFKGARTG